MFVGSGSLNDPPEVQGLAHFCEHMLFLGTKKYPTTNHYQEFIASNGGDSNAATGEEYTYFYHSVAQEKLDESLDIFAQFFIDPLFNQEAMDKEINAIESEFQMIKNEEAMATDQLEKSHIAVPGSIVNRFLIGNKASLDVDGLMEHLHKYYSEHYSSNLMSLCLVSPHSLQELEEMATRHFEQI